MTRWKIPLLALLLLAMPLGAAEWPRPRAVVLITIDTLRADAVGFNGHPEDITPFLDSLAGEGVVFTRAYAPSSWTPPSMASLFTGVYPTSHGVRTGDVTGQRAKRVASQPVLASSFVTLPEALQGAGYVTVGVHSNLHLQTRLGFSQGFDHYFDAPLFIDANHVNRHARALLRQTFGAQWTLNWKRQPTFLWVHYFDPHDPYMARQPWIGRYAPQFRKRLGQLPYYLTMVDLWKRFPRPGPAAAAQLRPLYDSEVSFTDENFRWLAGQLGLEDEDILLIVTSDHGEEFAEHGGLGHGNHLYEEVVAVPLFIRWPAAIPGGRTVDRPTSILDLYPTLVELCALAERPPAGTLRGQSLSPILRGETTEPERQLFFEVDQPPPHRHLENSRRPIIGVTDGRWKLVRERSGGAPAELYDLEEDPGELLDLAAEERDRVRLLERILKRWLDSLPPPPDDLMEAAVEDEELRRQLKALGYID